MKPLFTLIMFVVAAASSAKADSFTIIRDGRKYQCTSTDSRDPGGTIECAEEAYRGPFSKEEAMRLCTGSYSTAPARCAIDAYRGPFSKEEAIRLCTGGGSTATAECAIKAYQGPYSKEEALRICRAEPRLMMRSLKLMEDSPDVQSKIQLFKNKILNLF